MYLRLIFKNVFRNKLRSFLTVLGTMVLVLVVTLVWSVLTLLDTVTTEKSKNLKAIVTERWQIPSQMPWDYATRLSEGAARESTDAHPTDSMTWQFYGGTLDLKNRTRDNTLFAFAMEPSKLMTMMDELDNLPKDKAEEFAAVVKKLEDTRDGIILGRDRLAAMNMQVGDRMKLYSMNYKGIDLDFEIVGLFPQGRYDNNTAFRNDYLNAALDAWPRNHRGEQHPMKPKTLNLVWLRCENRDLFNQIANQVESAYANAQPSVKCETASSGIASFFEAYKDLIWGLRWLLAPAILATLALVIANAISISVRERRLEFAVLKVMGFRPWQILWLVIGESLLLGVSAGFTSAALTFVIVNYGMGGVKFPIAFIPMFLIPREAFFWGLGIGSFTALAGSIVPAWSARTIKVAEVFSKVA